MDHLHGSTALIINMSGNFVLQNLRRPNSMTWFIEILLASLIIFMCFAGLIVLVLLFSAVFLVWIFNLGLKEPEDQDGD